MVAGAWSEDPAVQLEATTSFRKLLSIGEKKRKKSEECGARCVLCLSPPGRRVRVCM